MKPSVETEVKLASSEKRKKQIDQKLSERDYMDFRAQFLRHALQRIIGLKRKNDKRIHFFLGKNVEHAHFFFIYTKICFSKGGKEE